MSSIEDSLKITQTHTRDLWLAALRQQGERQCLGAFRDDGGKVCALALARDVAGQPGVKLTQVLGISLDQFGEVILMNDQYGKTFSEIADVVSSWFPS